MTVQTDKSKAGPYAGAGTKGPFPVDFRFLEDTHLRVIKTDPAGQMQTLVLGTDYSVTGAGEEAGGELMLTANLPVGYTLVILRNVPATQMADYVEGDSFPAESHERALDKLTMLVQQQQETLGRALVMPESDTAVSGVLPPIAQRAKRYLSFDEDGRPVSTTFDVDAIARASQEAIDAADRSADEADRSDAAAGRAEASEAAAAASEQAAADFAGAVRGLIAGATPSVHRFIGDGVQTEFDLGVTIIDPVNALVFLDGANQEPVVDYTVDGSVLKFEEAPADGVKGVAFVSPNTALAIGDAKNIVVDTEEGLTTVEKYVRLLRDNQKRTPLHYSTLAEAEAAAATLPDGQNLQAPDSAGVWSKWTVADGALVFDSFISPLAIDIADAGATPGVDCGSLILSLIDKNVQIIVPSGSYTATVADEAGVIKLWANLSKITTIGKLVVTLPTGKLAIPAGAAVTSNLSGLSIKGQSPVPLSVSSVVSVTSGVFTAYDGFGVVQTDWRYHQVAYALADASGVSVGDYVHIPWVSGDNTEAAGVLAHLGIHEVIAKAGNQITVLISSHYTPSTVFTAMEMQKIPTVLSFATSATFGVPAMVVANGGILGGNTPNDLGGISDVVLVGKGCVLTMADGRSPSAFDAFGQGGHTGITARDNGRIAFGRNVCFSGWPAGSVAASRNSDISSSYPATSSMSGRNGFVASSSTMEIQNIIIGGRNYGTIATGSLNDGFENQDNAFMYCDNSWSVGNHRTGYSSTGNSYGNFSVGTAVGNKFDGVVSEASAILFKPGYCAFNGSNGLLAQNAGHINAVGAEVTKNGGNGVMATQASQIQFGGGKSSYNTGSDYLAHTGGQIHAVFAPITGYTPTSSPNFNVLGPSGSAVWSITNPTSIAIGVGSPAITLDSSNSALFGTNGSGFPTSRIKIGGNAAAAGGYYPSSDQTYNLNASAYRFNNSYFVNAPTVTSDGREKTEPQPIDDALLDAWGEVGFFAWQWLKSVQEKGGGARIHYGPIAQNIRDALVRHGYMQEGSTDCRHAPLCYDEWQDQYEPIMAERVNEAGEVEEYDTGEKRLVLAAGNRWGIRADQCLFLEAAYQRRRSDRIEQRLAVLEANP